MLQPWCRAPNKNPDLLSGHVYTFLPHVSNSTSSSQWYPRCSKFGTGTGSYWVSELKWQKASATAASDCCLTFTGHFLLLGDVTPWMVDGRLLIVVVFGVSNLAHQSGIQLFGCSLGFFRIISSFFVDIQNGSDLKKWNMSGVDKVCRSSFVKCWARSLFLTIYCPQNCCSGTVATCPQLWEPNKTTGLAQL